MKYMTMQKKIHVLEHAFASSAGAYYNINLTRNLVPGEMYQVIDDKEYSINGEIGLPPDASFTDVVNYWGKKLAPEEQPAYFDFLSIEHLLKHFQEGTTHVFHKYWTKSALLQPMLAEQHIVMYEDEETGDVLAVSYILDLTEAWREKEHKKELVEKQTKLEVALKMAEEGRKGKEAQKTLSAISETLGNLAAFDHVTNLEELRKELPALMASLGIYSKSDRAYIFAWASEEKQILRMTAEWVRDGVMPTMGIMQDVHMSDLPHWAPMLRRGEPIISLDWEAEKEKAPEEFAVFDGQDIHSLVVIPMFSAGKFNGYVGLDNPSLDMMDISIRVLSSVARYIGGLKSNLMLVDALEAKQVSLEQSIQELDQEKKILDALSVDYTSVYYCDLDADRMVTLKCNVDTNTVQAEKELTHDLETYSFRIQYYFDHYIIKESAPDFMEKMSAPFLKQYLSNHHRFAYRFRTKPNPAGQQYFEVQMVRLNQVNGFKVVMGYRYIDDIVAEQEKQKIQLEQALEEVKTRSEIIDSIGKIYWVIYRMDLENETYEEVSGENGIHTLSGNQGKLQDILELSLEHVIVPEQRDEMRKFWDYTTLADRLAHVETISQEYKTISGSWHWGRYIVKKRDSSGKAIHVLYVVRVIDKEKQKELEYQQKLLASAEEARFNSEVVGTISKFYWLIYQMDLPSGTYEEISAGEEVHHLTGKHGSTQEVFHEVVETVVAEEYQEKMQVFFDMSTLVERLQMVKQKNHAESISMEYQAKDGSWHVARFVVKKRDENGVPIHVLYIVRQINTEKQMEAEYKQKLWETAQEARRASMAKTDFLRRMSHDIRTPINGIRGLLTMADCFPDDMKKQQEYRDKMKETTGYLLDLVNSVLDMNKLESGSVILEHKPFDLNDIFRETRNIIAPQAKEKGISLQADEGGVQHHHLIGSPIHLRQILQNIASNAIKYSPMNSHIQLTTSEVEYKNGKAIFQMCCRDNGQGMSEDFLKKAFEPFAQENQDARTSYMGTGLGLAITKQLVELMGGTISLESQLHEGTTVTIRLPFEVDLSYEAPKEKEEKQDHVCLKGRKVLLVEDNELNMEIAKFVLEYRGLDVTVAMNGKEAVDQFAQSEEGFFDVILMDIMMPVMGGLEATRRIRAMDRNDAKTIPIFAMTANAFLEDQKRSKDAGMNEHLTKPLKKEVVFETIAKYLK